MKISIALIGDYNESVIAHQAIPKAIELAADALKVDVSIQWIASSLVEVERLDQFHAIWCVPASPYESQAGVLSAIQFARRENVPYLGTCAGYQHAVLEYARNVLGFEKADNAEDAPDTEMPLISALVCKLNEKTGSIIIEPNSQASVFYRATKINETYNCSFGVNPDYLFIFENSGLCFTGKDETAEPRILEIPQHRFFIGTAFQPERSALNNQIHPLIVGFLQAAVEMKIATESK